MKEDGKGGKRESERERALALEVQRLSKLFSENSQARVDKDRKEKGKMKDEREKLTRTFAFSFPPVDAKSNVNDVVWKNKGWAGGGGGGGGRGGGRGGINVMLAVWDLGTSPNWVWMLSLSNGNLKAARAGAQRRRISAAQEL